MIEVRFDVVRTPPKGWKPADANRPASPFSASYRATKELLDAELWAIDAVDCLVQVDTAGGNITRQGSMRADAKVAHPGVIVTVETKKLGSLIYATDKFGNGMRHSSSGGYVSVPPWHSNLRAIALGMKALRTVDRYGIAEQGQQYAGYRELGSGIPLGERPEVETMTAAEAALILTDGIWQGDRTPAAIVAMVEHLYREQAKRLHPDAGGDPESFRRLVMARNLLANL